MKEIFDPKTQNQCSLIYMTASIIAEAVSMVVYYPYEIIKVRMIAKNDKFNYTSIPDAFKKICASSGFKGLYSGSGHFLINYILSSTIQLAIYETYMDLKKKK